METLGVDVGGVIIDRVNDGTDTAFFSDNYLNTTAVPNVMEVLHRLVTERFGNRVYIVSKCGQKVQDKTLRWFAHHSFFERTGIKPENVRFTRTREGKAPICMDLGITHFVDDRLEVLSHLSTVGEQFLFQGQTKEMNRFSHHLKRVHQVVNWQQIEEMLL